MHKHHKHIPFREAFQMLRDDLAIVVGEDASINAIVEHLSNGYTWKSRMSDGFNVKQFVRVVQG